MKESEKNKTTPSDKEQIVDWYINDVLEGNIAGNVYLFCKNHKIDESEFYQLFSGFNSIENHFFSLLFDKTIQTISKSPNYENYSGKEKLLSMYYTFFGNLTQNRSFVMYLFKNQHFNDIKKFTKLRWKFIEYLKTLDIEQVDLRIERLSKVRDRSLNEAVWIQFLSIFRFWLKDDSAGFEKTDVYIEKSTVAGFELINTKPLKSVLDLGKFLWKEMNPVS